MSYNNNDLLHFVKIANYAQLFPMELNVWEEISLQLRVKQTCLSSIISNVKKQQKQNLKKC